MSRIRIVKRAGRRIATPRGLFKQLARRLERAKKLPKHGARMIDPRSASPGHKVVQRPPRLPANAAPFRPELAEHVPPYGLAGKKATGVVDLGGERVIYQTSGKWPLPPAIEGAGSVLRAHVEFHTLSRMREAGLKEATLYLNRAPCSFFSGGIDGCMNRLAGLMRPGEKLTVYFPGPNGPAVHVFTAP